MKFCALQYILCAPVGDPVGGGAGGSTIPAAIANARLDASRVEKAFVAPKTADDYVGQLIRFLLHLFDKHEGLIPEPHLAQMTMYNANDARTFQEKPTRKDDEDPRKELRGYIRRVIDNIQPAREGAPHNSPFNIDGNNALTYEVIRDYMITKYNVVEVDKDAAVKYLRAIGKSELVTPQMQTGPRKVKLEVYQSESTFSAIRSAVAYVYKTARVAMPDDMSRELPIFIEGMKRTETAAKRILGLKIQKGKDPLSWEGYEYCARTLFLSGEMKDVYFHTFLVLDWNLMKRAENCVDAKINNISFQDDSLVFEFEKCKTRQTGDPFGPWHVYSNPEKPWLCPVLALARYLFCYPEVLRGDVPLFEGTNQYARYSAGMLKFYKEHQDDLRSMGIDYKSLGSHSARKGVGTMVASGCTIGPPIVPLCLRAGWKLGGVKDKYLFLEGAGDMYCGRCAVGLNPTTIEFGISCAYFDYTELVPDERIRMKIKVNDHLAHRIPNFSEVDANALKLAQYCFAALCKAHTYLSENLHANCPLRNAAVFKDIPEDILQLAVTKYPWNETADTPKFTGLPPHIVSLAKLESLERTVANIPNTFMGMMREEMDNRQFFATEHNTHEILNAVSSLTTKIVEELLEKTNLVRQATMDAAAAGAADQNRANNDELIIPDEDEDGLWCDQQLTNAANADSASQSAQSAEQLQLNRRRAQERAAATVKKRKLKVGYHHGKLNPLTSTFQFAPMTCLQLIQNWFIGDLNRNIPPLYSLDSKHVEFMVNGKGGKRGNQVRNKMVSFMRIVEKEALLKHVWVEKQCDWTHHSVIRMWDAISQDFTTKYCQTKRKKELKWSTVYSNMSAANAFNNPRNKKNKNT